MGICIAENLHRQKCRTNASILRPMLYLNSEEWSQKIDFFWGGVIHFVFVVCVNYEIRNSVNFNTFCTDRNYNVLEKNKGEIVAVHAARATGGAEV